MKTDEVEIYFTIPEKPDESVQFNINEADNTATLLYNSELIDSISLDHIGTDFYYTDTALFGKIGIRKKNNLHYELTFNDIHSLQNVSHPFNMLKFLPHVLFLISIGPILDIFFRLSLFSKDPAPEGERVLFDLLFFVVYAASAYLVLKHKYWATWISFTVYTLTTVVCLMIINAHGLMLSSLLEITVRLSILLFLISKISAILSVSKYQQRKG